MRRFVSVLVPILAIVLPMVIIAGQLCLVAVAYSRSSPRNSAKVGRRQRQVRGAPDTNFARREGPLNH